MRLIVCAISLYNWVFLIQAQIAVGTNLGMSSEYLYGVYGLSLGNEVLGYDGGLCVSYGLGTKYSISAEIGYSKHGGATKINLTDNFGNSTDEILRNAQLVHSLRMPILVGRYFGNQSRFSVHTGPYFGGILASKIKQTTSGSSPEAEFSNTSSFNSLEIGWCVSGYYSFKISEKINIDVGPRLSMSILNVFALPGVNARFTSIGLSLRLIYSTGLNNKNQDDPEN